VDVDIHVSLTSVLVGGEWWASQPGRFNPKGKSPRYPTDRRLGGLLRVAFTRSPSSRPSSQQPVAVPTVLYRHQIIWGSCRNVIVLCREVSQQYPTSSHSILRIGSPSLHHVNPVSDVLSFVSVRRYFSLNTSKNFGFRSIAVLICVTNSRFKYSSSSWFSSPHQSACLWHFIKHRKGKVVPVLN
jgi:hypothetical protein